MTFFSDSTAIVSNFSSTLNILLLITTLAMGALNIRNKYEKGKDEETLTTLKDSNDAFAAKREADKIVLEARDAEIRLLKQKAEILESHVTQAPDITKLIEQLTTQQKEAAKTNKSILDGIGKLINEVGNLAKAMNKENK